MGSEEILCARAPDRDLVSFDGLEQRRRIAQQRPTVKMNKRIALFPIIFFQIYLATSVLTFAFGPWQWPVSNPWQLYSFLILAQVALLAGYLNAIKKQPRPASTKLRVPVAVTVSLVFNYLWIGQIYKGRSGQTFDLGGFVAAVTGGLTDPGQRYDEKLKNYLLLRAAGAITIQDYVGLLLFPLLWIAFPLGVVFWKRLSIPVRVALVVWTILDLSIWVAAGTNKGIADFILLLPCLLVARKPAMLANIKRRNAMVVGLIAIIGVAALVAFFSAGMLGRSGGKTVMLYEHTTGIGADPDHPALRYLPPELQGPLALFASYFNQGYYGLSLALKEPFIFCYGVGHSYFLEGLSRHLVSTPIILNTYPARIAGNGWDPYLRWSSIYPWIASDLSFPGTIVFMFLIGRLFGLVWLDVAFCRNPWAVCLLPLLLTMLFYVPANNQVLAFANAALPFWALLFMWYFSRARGDAKRRVILTS
jgi:hypothetical protein